MDGRDRFQDRTIAESVHSLRSHLTVAKLAAELLRRKNPDPIVEEKLHRYLQEALDRLAHAVNELEASSARAPVRGRH